MEMAQVKSEEKLKESTNKLNAHAPEFVPRSQTQTTPISGYFYPCFHFLGGSSGSDWFYVGEQEPTPLISNSNVTLSKSSKNFLSDDLRQNIINQVENQFSDMSLVLSDTLMKHINKDPEGYVPISVIASSKKIKSLVSNNYLLTQALRTSLKLVVSDDGKKVRRKHIFTDRDKEDLQSRTVVAENLPEDHSHQTLEKIFGAVGSVKTVRVCHPHESNAFCSKNDVLISNKLHALVEYETVDQAEKAVEKLNDGRDWRKGLRVRLLHRRSPRSVVKSMKSDYDHFDGNSEEDGLPLSESSENFPCPKNLELSIENNAEHNSTLSKKGRTQGRGKSRGRSQNRNGHSSTQPSSSIQWESSIKQTPRGPRMPDGTRGFTMGRGKPISVLAQPSSLLE